MMINLNKVWNDNPFDQWTEEELLCMEGQGICYGKGSSSPPPPPTVTTQTQVSEFPTELRPFISDIFEKSQAVQEQRQAEGFQPELTQQLAPFTGDQQTAFEGIRQQVGQTRPLFNEATELARSSARGATDPAELAALMNPFLRNVVDTEKREAERVADVQEQQLAARAAQAGAFGGSRAGIIESERQRNLATQLGDIETRGLALAFNDAQNRLQNQFGREASAAGQLASLGTAIPAQTFKELGALSGIGAAEQQQGQRALDIATQQAREEFGFPQQTLQDFSSILRGFPLPATTNVSKSTFSPAQPLSTQLIGLGAGLAGLAGNAGAFGKAGGRVGALAPIGLKNGGYVKLAGGGGLGEMMQKNLPSNRVRMGKVAYQDASGVPTSPVAPIPPGTLYEMTQEILKILENEGEAGLIKIQSKFPREAINFALAQANSSQTSPPVTGDAATAAITKASQTGRDTLVDRGILSAKPASYTPPTNRSKNPKDLSFLQKAFGVADDIAGGVSAAKPVTVSLDPKMGVKVPQVQEQAQTVKTGLPPAQSQLLSGDPTADFGPTSTVMGGSYDPVPRGSAQKVTAPSSPPALPPPATPPNFGATSTVMGSSYDPVPRGSQQRVIAPPPAATPLQSTTPAPSLRSTAAYDPRIFSESPGATYGLEPDNRKALEQIVVGTAKSRNPVQRLLHSTGIGSGLVSTADTFTEGAEILGDAVFKGVLAPKAPYNPLAIPGKGFRLLSTGTPDPAKAKELATTGMFPDQMAQYGVKAEVPDIGTDTDTASDSTQPPKIITDNEEVSAIASTPDGGVAEEFSFLQVDEADPAAKPADPAAKPADPANVTQDKADYDKQISDIKSKDYSDDIKAMLGDAPTYEKGEEPDFAARKWLALANFGAGLLASGGGKTLAQSVGEAAKPALKELADIGKEERKIKSELRKERNAQKRADYQDDLKRFDLQRQLKSDDLKMYTGLAKIRQEEEANKISATNAQTNKNRMISENATRKVQRVQKEFENRIRNKGQLTFGEADKIIEQVLKRSSTAAQTGAKSIVTGMTDTKKLTESFNAAFNAELPTLVSRLEGRLVDQNGNPVSRERIMLMLGKAAGATPPPKPGTTVNVTGAGGATVTMGSNTDGG